MRVLELANRLRARGLTVVEMAGWTTRGREFPVRPDGVLRHWTAGAATGYAPSLGIVTHGRSDLAGPLYNTLQSRQTDAHGLDVIYLVAAGKANHAGSGTWNGMSGNYRLLGHGIEWSGPGEPFANVRRRKLTSELAMRAMMDCAAGDNDDDAAEHREYAPTRKIDTNLDGGELRRRMRDLRSGPSPAPAPAPSPSRVRDRLRAGEFLGHSQSLRSVNRCFTLIHQSDGNVVLYMGPQFRPDTAIWKTGTHGRRTTALHMQPDGNLVLYNGRTPVWSSGTHGRWGAFVVLQDDGNLVIYHGGRAIWDSQGHARR